jgi:hypothetical protein
LSPTDSGFDAITAIRLERSPNNKGMPRVGMLCWGETKDPLVRRFVVTTNVTAWNSLEPLSTWARDARKSGLPDPYANRITYLSNRLARRGGFTPRQVLPAFDLPKAWKNAINTGPPTNADAALQATWTRICNTNPNSVTGPRSFDRLRVSTALAFDCRLGSPRTRTLCTLPCAVSVYNES